ncbi:MULTISPECIES: lactate racemase domain-containing protein [unclassified Nocardioides]|uniref:lactate racemase domain-containing protein n=1 Tax=unclassified Nocardioides TaxID=2615069 RepID=UPI0007028A7C|nr:MULTISPECIES: lactate racemase domain-containing protein [unclassified Nocardioides]KQP64718.1 transcriptional regulator [Nocardioides sp. Leaf285]KQQ43730.1 transcriptional regulator [Nocardioides sp. Leaf307]
MPRPGFVLEVDDRTPPLLVHEGLGFRLEDFPQGTRVVYPPESLPAVRDVEAAITDALLHPLGSDPLPERLFPGMRLTLAFDDVSLPLPPMRAPDIRQRVIEQVLTLAAEAGVDDVEIIAANALHRRMTTAELRHIVGERVFRSFHPQGKLYNFDAEDRDNLTHLGTTDEGEDIEISKRAAESDLLVYVNVNLVAMDGGHKSVGIGLASYRSLRHHHNPRTMVHSRSFMDHEKSAMHHSAWRIGRVIKEHVAVFQIETTLDNQVFPAPFDFLMKREWEWSLRDQASMLAARRGLALAPAKLRHKIFHDLRAPYGLTGIAAGEVEEVHEKTLERVHRQQLVEVDGASDVLVLGVPFLGPYNVGSSMNPVLATCMGLGYYFNSYRNHPVVRRGGAVILYHPLDEGFNQLHHPSYVDFYEEVLSETTDPVVLSEKYERQFAEDDWYRHLYRTSHAYHGVHPFYMWYWAAHAMDHVGDVVWVGGDRRVAARLGFRAASTLADALEMVSGSVGSSPSITYLHNPPHLVADVRV